jgi:hypothetical protein
LFEEINTISGDGGYDEGGDVWMWMSKTGDFYRTAEAFLLIVFRS